MHCTHDILPEQESVQAISPSQRSWIDWPLGPSEGLVMHPDFKPIEIQHPNFCAGIKLVLIIILVLKMLYQIFCRFDPKILI